MSAEWAHVAAVASSFPSSSSAVAFAKTNTAKCITNFKHGKPQHEIMRSVCAVLPSKNAYTHSYMNYILNMYVNCVL